MWTKNQQGSAILWLLLTCILMSLMIWHAMIKSTVNLNGLMTTRLPYILALIKHAQYINCIRLYTNKPCLFKYL